MSHAKAQSPQSGNEYYWLLVAAMPRAGLFVAFVVRKILS
jgi:hypothetical protein